MQHWPNNSHSWNNDPDFNSLLAVLSDLIKCDKINRETDAECIQRLQQLLLDQNQCLTTETVTRKLVTTSTTTSEVTTTEKINVCTCKNGQPKTLQECLENGKEDCESCDPGFHFDSGRCVEKINVCTCANGDPKKHPECNEDGKEHCESCDPGFQLEAGLCMEKINVCTCNNGQPKIHPECRKDGQEDCEECYPGFQLDSDSGRCVYKGRLSLSDFKFNSDGMAVREVLAEVVSYFKFVIFRSLAFLEFF